MYADCNVAKVVRKPPHNDIENDLEKVRPVTRKI